VGFPFKEIVKSVPSEMLRVEKQHKTESAPNRSKDGQNDSYIAQPARGVVILRSKCQKQEQERENRHSRVEKNLDGIVLLHDGRGLTRLKISDRASEKGCSHALKARHKDGPRFAASPG
jgi:hypothetical protein